jgi:hypothetical protein
VLGQQKAKEVADKLGKKKLYLTTGKSEVISAIKYFVRSACVVFSD